MVKNYKCLCMKNFHRPSSFRFYKEKTLQYIFTRVLLLIFLFMGTYEFYLSILVGGNEQHADFGALDEVLTVDDIPQQNSTLLALKSTIEEINKAQVIRNFNDSKITNDTVIILIQVHKRIVYLEALINSLSSVRDINSTLLIFSHDYFSKEINELVYSIDFAPVLQIFFPFSIQLHPYEFPGTSPKDCTRDVGIIKAKAQGCVGANTPDTYGHYRLSEVTQMKHHWWWKINRVFDELNATKNFTGYVLFLEEDHYLAPDALYTLKLMIDLAAVKCPQCNSFNIGNFGNHQLNRQFLNKVYIAPWSNLGYSFNRSIWHMLHSCSHVFCTFDDYNWDWSYHYTSQQCFSQKLTNLVLRASRVFHIGDCGMHHKKEGCDLNKSMEKAKKVVISMHPFLFPKRLILDITKHHQPYVTKGWGGWADPRDIQLCLKISEKKTHE